MIELDNCVEVVCPRCREGGEVRLTTTRAGREATLVYHTCKELTNQDLSAMQVAALVAEGHQIRVYEVGGAVRDRLLGVKSKDIDYAVEAPSFSALHQYIEANGGEIFLETPEYFTIRARVGKVVSDYVLCRREFDYDDKRRPSRVEMGTIDDDLARRDFTVNAMAIREDRTLYDPHGGLDDLARKVLRCVGNPVERFGEDPLRLVRALRFSITKDFTLHYTIKECLQNLTLVDPILALSLDRVRDELTKCFAANTPRTLELLQEYPLLRRVLFMRRELWLKPTTEKP